ncbi:phosphate ABC transporter permease PstA [Methanoregula sp.]|jgi:phosphate transport system permease protein|uniref:phosphate ABC transporter permease PstA n=1 Tax=Methanoregula sp. TaxID=2052170 RepID=UPI003C14E007
MKTMRRQVTEKIITGLCLLATLAVVGVLFLIIGQIFINGLPSLSLYFITTPENATPGLGQGIANAIAGTVLISLCAVIFAAPFGFGTAIYMKRYAPDNAITRAFRFLLEVLSGTPSIVVGVFGFLVFVIYLKKITGGYSLIAGSLALAILIMPVIERAIEDAIDRVSRELEEGSYALGADKWQTIRGITIPTAFTGILTGLTLGFGRAAEESAVVILTAGYTQYMPDFGIHSGSSAGMKIYPIQDQVATLPYAVYHAFQNQTLVKPSAGFAAAFVLVVIVFTINIGGKMLLQRTMNAGKPKNSLIGMIREKLSAGKPRPEQVAGNQIESLPEPGPAMPEPTDQPGSSFADRIRNLPLVKKIILLIGRSGKKENPSQIPSPENDGKKRTLRLHVLPFLRPLLPFAIPAVLLLLISFLAGIPPLHQILGPASPALAGLFASVLALIVTVAGLIFGILLAKRSGAFKAKTRRTGYAAVGAGFCILCIAGIICSSAAAGLFMTGDEPAVQAGGDRAAKLAAMAAGGELGDGSGSTVSVQTVAPAMPAPSSVPPQVMPGAATTQTVPVKDALDVGEYYWYGDAEHTSRATVYDYKVLPFYFWWFIDYNRFVQQVPPPGYSYLVVFLRIEDVGTKSAIVPSADQIVVTNNGNSYSHELFFNQSVLSSYQTTYYEYNYNALPYQWIREIGQDKRDYAFLTDYNIFGDNFWLNNGTTVTPTPATTSSDTTDTTNSTTDTNGEGFFLHPGSSNAIDGYLIYTVPNSALNTTEDLKSTYVQVTFNNFSATRWRLGTDVPG